MRSTVLGLLDPIFGCPRGIGGRLGVAILAGVNADTERYVVGQAKLRATDHVLVLGPATGEALRTAATATPSGTVVVVDPSELVRDQTRRRCADLIPDGRIRLLAGTADATGLPTASVDAVISVDNAPFWPDLTAALTELRRVLKPGGTLLVTAHTWLAVGLDATRLRTAATAAGLHDIQAYDLAHTAPTGSAHQLQATA
jgi:SAM-dependent methyltransferase